MKFKNNIEVQSGIADNNSLTGDSGQILSSTETGVEWIDQNAITSSSDFVFFNVKNETGSTILKGKGVMAVGTDGNSGHILVDEMVANGTVESKYFLGVLEEDIPNGGFARVISFGQLSQFNTSGQNGETWEDGQVLWCDPDSPGDFTITEPDGPNVKIAAAFILNSSTNGKIQVRVQANEGIHDLHDTKITSQVDGDVLVWDNTTGVWFNDSTLNVDYTNSRVGIGTTSPNDKLEVAGFIRTTGDDGGLLIGHGSGGYGIKIGRGRIGDGLAYLDFIGSEDPSGGTYDTRFLKNPGDNGNFDIYHNGTGHFSINATSGGDILLLNGNVGIGVSNPSAKLEVYGSLIAGVGNTAIGNSSQAFGINTDATGNQAAAFGSTTLASGNNATAFGHTTIASGPRAFSTGFGTEASGLDSTVHGNNNTASGVNSFVSGQNCTASSYNSAALGSNLSVISGDGTAVGAWNLDADNYRFQVGVGTSDTNRINAFSINTNGIILAHVLLNSASYSNDSQAAAGGVPKGGLYRNGSIVQIRIN